MNIWIEKVMMSIKKVFTTKNIIFLILLIITLCCLPTISDVVMLFFVCFVLSCSLLPLVDKLERIIKNRTLSAIIVMTAAAVLTLAFILPVANIAIEQISIFIQSLPDKITEFHAYTKSFSIAGHQLSYYLDYNKISGGDVNFTQNVLNKSVNITLSFFQGLLIFVAIVTIMFYMLKDTEYMKSKFLEFFPDNMKERTSDIADKIASKVGGYVIATIISGGAIWLCMSILLMLLKIEYPISLGLISGILDIIPVLGPTIALTLILLVAFKRGLLIIVFAIIAFLGVQQLSNNVIRPIVFGKFMELHPLMIIFAICIGGKFGGIAGVIFAPAIVAIITVLIDELYLKEINKK